MGSDIGFDTQTPSLPQGGGAISGLGETFTPDLATGTGTFTVKLDLPHGPNDIGPRLSLRYDTASGNGPYGQGFSLALPRLLRSTARGYPRFDASDTLMLEGAGELVALGGGKYRPQVDGGAWRAEAVGAGFRLADREGLFYFMGATPAGRLSGPIATPGAEQTYAWNVERIEDALGNAVTLTWLRDRGQLYLSTVSYGAYRVELHYESRPDPIRWGQAGFLVTTALRCTTFDLLLPSDAQPLVRRWTLSYTQDPANGGSLLTGVTLSGFDAAGAQLDAPPLRLKYTAFRPREMVRFRNADDGAAPGPLARRDRRIELIDWNGDGLPDLLEIAAGGRSRVWPNAGDCTWGRPQDTGDLPLFASPTAQVGFADMNGDGAADLVRLDRLIDGFVPRRPGPTGGFDRPIVWRQAPGVAANAANARLIDLDGDGVLDLLSSSTGYLALYYRSDPEGWAARPQVVPRGAAPDLDLADPHVFLADMTGSGSLDLVRVTRSSVTYWPYLGMGRWAEPVTMVNPPALPFDFRPRDLFLSDVDGDGCADAVYLDAGKVRYWINQSGNGFGAPREVDFVPTAAFGEFRLADMRGSGAAGVLWATGGPFGHTAYYYLDFSGDSKPHLLAEIDNGVGLTTRIDYTTSARQAAADAQAGQPWSTFLPVVVPLVGKITTVDAATGRTGVTAYRYHDGRYDGVLREFAGFGRADEEQAGDATSAMLRTTTWFHNGLDLATQREPATHEERRRLRAIRGRIYRQEHYGLDGSPRQELPYDRLEQQWIVESVTTPAGPVDIPRLAVSRRSVIEREAAAVSAITTTNLAWDAAENITDSLQTSEAFGDPGQTRTLRTRTAYAVDPTGRFAARASRVQQFDSTGKLIANTVTEYDGLPEGQCGSQGLVTRRSALVLSDELATEVYGAAVPDFASLGYFRRPGEIGWWITQAAYARTDDGIGLRGRVTGPRGSQTFFDFDPNKTYPVRVVDPAGNSVTTEHDYRACRVKRLVDASGAEYLSSFDALARPLATVEPGDSDALPTASYDYATASVPVTAAVHRRGARAATVTIDSREAFDGSGKLIERRIRDDAGEIVVLSQRYSARGFLAQSFVEFRPGSPTYVAPADTMAHTTYVYDALGRQVRQENADGSLRTIAYGPLVVEEADAEDTRTGPAASHAGTPTRKRIDPTGRVSAIEENLGGRWVVSTYEYDLKGNLTRHTDATGNAVRLWYDFLGRTLRCDRPEQSSISVFDAAGNAVEARPAGGTPVLREFDESNRPVTVRYGSTAAAPAIRFTYHDAGRPAPAEAGAHTAGGRCVRIDDEGGTTIFDYDARGKVAIKRSRPAGSATTYELGFQYRSDGQLASVLYPDGGSGRTLLRYEYDRRGQVSRVPSIVSAIEYNLAGQRTRVQYANGTEQIWTYDPTTGRLSSTELRGPGGVLRSLRYTSDLAGNLVRIDSPNPKLATTYVYDDLYRLTAATFDAGESWQYAYDDAGNLAHRSDVGDYHYGENGVAATCLTSAGGQQFSYSPTGEMLQTPWGTQSFDPMGRLVRIVRPGQGQMDFTYDYAGIRVAAHTSGGAAPAVDRLTPDALYAVEAGSLVINFFDGAGIAARQTIGGGLSFLHVDHLGSLAAVTDGAGSLIESLRYDPYGLLLERTGAAPGQPYGFTGGTLDDWSGLVYLTARYYHPGLGRFVSPDPVVQNTLEPVAWSAYVYCRNNPATYVDPTGRNFWGIFLAALAIVALIVVTIICVVLDVFTFGAMTPLLAVGIIALGMVVGGVVGGLAASAHGGSTEDIITGILVGAAVGGWAAFAGLFAGPAVSAMGVHGFGGAVLAGAISGTVSGAAIGFAAGYAGGKGSLEEIWTKVWQGALVGLVAGAVMGGLGYAIKPPDSSLSTTVQRAYQPDVPSASPAGAVEPPPSGALATTAPPGPTTFGSAATQVGTGLLGKGASAAGGWLFSTVMSSPLSQLAAQLVVDASAGAWDLGYAPWILNKIGVVSYSGKLP